MKENCTCEVMQKKITGSLFIPLPLDWTTLLYTYIRYMYDYKCRKYVQFYVFVIYSIYIHTINMSSFNMSITPKDPNHKGIHICITTSSKILQLQVWCGHLSTQSTLCFSQRLENCHTLPFTPMSIAKMESPKTFCLTQRFWPLLAALSRPCFVFQKKRSQGEKKTNAKNAFLEHLTDWSYE